MGKDSKPDSRLIATNRKARFEYEVIEKFETGIALTGSEVKSLRDHKVSIAEAYARFQGDELFIINLDIAAYADAGYAQHEPKRVRKLLMHRRELKRLMAKVKERGFTLIPLGMHFNERGIAKVSLALAKGKQIYDKRRAIRDREQKRDVSRQMRRYK
jgi:SsrA-binding protein